MKDLWRIFKTYWIWLALTGVLVFSFLSQIFLSLKREKQYTYEENGVAILTTILFFYGVWEGRKVCKRTMGRVKHFSSTLLVVLGVCVFVFFFFIGSIVKILVFTTDFQFPAIFLFTVVSGGILGFTVEVLLLFWRSKLITSESKLANVESELKLLQSQLSPHFLFNTLNSIYGLTLRKSDKAPVLVLKLSDLLRYSVYDTGEQFVPLSKEIDYLKNYIDFEKVRLGDRLELSLHLEEGSNLQIAPMLLMVFVENAFKHARNSSEDKIFVGIVLKSWEKNVLFSIENSFEVQKTESRNLNAESGLGIENAKRRLELMYPKKHTLSMRQERDRYKVSLQIETE